MPLSKDFITARSETDNFSADLVANQLRLIAMTLEEIRGELEKLNNTAEAARNYNCW